MRLDSIKRFVDRVTRKRFIPAFFEKVVGLFCRLRFLSVCKPRRFHWQLEKLLSLTKFLLRCSFLTSRVARLAQRSLARKEVGRLEMSTCRHIAFFAVFVYVEPLPLDLRRNPQTYCSSYERTKQSASHHGQCDRDDDCF